MLIATVGVIGLYPGGLPKTCNKWVKDPFFERDPKKPSWSTVYSVLAGPKLYLQMLEMFIEAKKDMEVPGRSEILVEDPSSNLLTGYAFS